MDQSGGISCRPSNILNINGILKAIEWVNKYIYIYINMNI